MTESSRHATSARLFASLFAGRRFFVVAITDHCDMECPICFAESTRRGQAFLSLEQLRQLALQVKAAHGTRLSLSGGEPTLHPDLLEIVRMLSSEVRLAPVLVTNGLRLAEEPDYASMLKRAGLRGVHLQFDGLDDHCCLLMRGRPIVQQKLRAVDNILAAGLQLALIATVCSWNLAETANIVGFARHLGPGLRMIIFQPAVPIGRAPRGLEQVTREDVIHALVRSGGKYDLQESDFFPFPQSGPNESVPHPDCSANVLMCVESDRMYPYFRASPAINAIRCAAETPCNVLSSEQSLPASVLSDERTRQSPHRSRHIFMISVIAFMNARTRDDARLARCIALTATQRGFVPLCQESCARRTIPFKTVPG